MFLMFLQLYILIARKGLPKGMMLTMGDGIILVPVQTGARPTLLNIGWDFVLMFPFFKKIRQRKILRQSRAFISWTQKLSNTSYLTHQEVICKFIRDTYYTDGVNITEDFINEYSKNTRSRYAEKYTKQSLTMFRRFCMRLIIRPDRAKLIIMKKHLGGRQLEIKRIRKVQELRKANLSYREISKKLKINISLAHRWSKIPQERLIKEELKLSTEKVD